MVLVCSARDRISHRLALEILESALTKNSLVRLAISILCATRGQSDRHGHITVFQYRAAVAASKRGSNLDNMKRPLNTGPRSEQ